METKSKKTKTQQAEENSATAKKKRSKQKTPEEPENGGSAGSGSSGDEDARGRKKLQEKEKEKEKDTESPRGDNKKLLPRLTVPNTALTAIGLKFSPRKKKEQRGSMELIKGRERSYSCPLEYNKKDEPEGEVTSEVGYVETKEGIEVVHVDGKEFCKAGSLGKIVEWMVANNEDPFCVEVFIIAYRQFVSALTFFNILMAQYAQTLANIPTSGMVTVELQRFLELLKTWLQKYLMRDFLATNEKSLRLFDSLYQFMTRLTRDGYGIQANEIKLLMLRTKAAAPRKKRKRSKGYSNRGSHSRRYSSSIDLILRESPESSPTRFSQLTFADLQPMEVAEVMTMLEFHLFHKIKEGEFLDLNWKRKDQEAKHIKKIVNRSNKVSFWVATTIASCKDLNERISLLKRYIVLAERCRELRNFSTLMEILGGLNMHPIARLKKTWQGLPEKYLELFHDLEALMDTKANYMAYREALAEEPMEGCGTVPYLGVYLRDLIFIEEGNRTIHENGLINFEKLQLIGKVIVEVQRFQKVQYTFHPTSPETFRTVWLYVKQLSGEDEKHLDDLSYACEPNRNSVSVARLPSLPKASGFVTRERSASVSAIPSGPPPLCISSTPSTLAISSSTAASQGLSPRYRTSRLSEEVSSS